MMTDRKAYDADFQRTRPLSVAELKANGTWEKMDEPSKRGRLRMDRQMTYKERMEAKKALEEYKKLLAK